MTKSGEAKKSPVKKSVARPAAKSGNGSRIALFIDLDNAGVGLINLQEVISILRGEFEITYGKLYGYTDDRAAEFEETVREHKFETAGKLRLKFGNASVIDLRLIMDVINVTEKNAFDAVFVWAGTGDFIPLFAHLRDHNVKVITADVPTFDCKNKFVTKAITLYSANAVRQSPAPANSQQPQQVAPQNIPQMPMATSQALQASAQGDLTSAADMQSAIFDAEPIPVLPRKKGAPTSKVEEEMEELMNEEDVTDEEMRRYLLESARKALEESIEGTSDGISDMGDLSNSLSTVSMDDLPEDDDKFVAELMEIGEFNKPEIFGDDVLSGANDAAESADDSDDFVNVGDDFGSLNRR